MIDLVSKIVAILVAITPLLVVLDKSKRFSHRRKFYITRMDELKKYMDNYYKKPISEIEKNCAAQILVASEKIGYKEVDYLIENHPKDFFVLVDHLIRARQWVSIKKVNNIDQMVTKHSKKKISKFMIFLIISYFSSLLILFINDFAVYILSLFNINPIINDSFYFIGSLALLSIFMFFISIVWTIFWSIDSVLYLYSDANLKYEP